MSGFFRHVVGGRKRESLLWATATTIFCGLWAGFSGQDCAQVAPLLEAVPHMLGTP